MATFQAAIAKLRAEGPIRAAWEHPVPKRDGLTRTGHALDLPERTLYQALIDSFVHDVEARLASRDNVYGYRASGARRSARPFGKRPIEQWLAFHRRVKDVAATGYEAVVITDVAAFFEQIPHEELGRQLRLLGVASGTVAELQALLGRLMNGRNRGIPQGNDASSVLGSLYLSAVDKAVLRSFPAYYRYVDDIRIFATSEGEVRKALRLLESEVRKLGLNLQPGKTKILVGAAAMKAEILDADAEVDGVDYVWKARTRNVAIKKVKSTWRSASRRKSRDKRLIKFLINRFRMARSDAAVNWCLKRLGILDWLADTVAPYLAMFANRPKVQEAIDTHLRSAANLSRWEECALLRCLLSADRLRRSLVDYALERVEDRNEVSAVRQWAAVLVGRHGNAADWALLEPYVLDGESLARAMIVSFQPNVARRGTIYASIVSAFPRLKPLADRLKGSVKALWPVFPVW